MGGKTSRTPTIIGPEIAMWGKEPIAQYVQLIFELDIFVYTMLMNGGVAQLVRAAES